MFAILRRFLACGTLAVLVLVGESHAGERINPAKAKLKAGEKIGWYDIRLLGVEGQGWKTTAAPFDRLPAKAEKIARKPVWSLSRHSAGLCVRFVTDATTLNARWTLRSKRLAMPHMAATGVSGLDLYVKTEHGRWHWLAVGRPTKLANSTRLFVDIPAGKREYLLYLPLYNGVSSVEIGLPKSARLFRADSRLKSGPRKPILFY
ncbi:MAG: hypothetical protein IID45_14715, partial [Planctomycetes bacterium]|nr:hypothetical protein [Planctomycetota bacterium]